MRFRSATSSGGVNSGKMVRLTVTLALLFFVCVHAAPVPGNPKFTLLEDSSFGLGVAGSGSKTNGVLEGNRSVEAPLPGNTGDNVPDVTVFKKVNVGAGFAFDESISGGVVKNNVFSEIKTPL